MANNLKGRPWIVDTTGLVKQGQCFTTGFVFRGYSNGAASLATIKDGNRGINIATLLGNAAGTPVGEAWFTPQVLNDLTITLDSGFVEVIVL